MHEFSELLVVGGLNLGQTTSGLYQELKIRLPEEFPQFVFSAVGNPFKGWQHPLTWSREQEDEYPCVKLLKCWATLCQFALDHITPALNKGHIVLTQRLGIDTVLYSIGHMPSRAKNVQLQTFLEEQNRHAEGLHHKGIVPGIVGENIKKIPYYAIPRADAETTARGWARIPELRELDPELVRAFIEYEHAAMDRYFHPSLHQNPPIYLDASQGIRQMADEAVDKFGKILSAKARLKAA